MDTVAAILAANCRVVIAALAPSKCPPAFQNGAVDWISLSSPAYRLGSNTLGGILTRGVVRWLAIGRARWRKPDLVIIHDMNDALYRSMGTVSAKRTCISNHGSVACYSGNLRYPWGSVDEAVDTMARYDFNLFVSQRCRKEWLALGPLRSQRSLCIPNCCREDAALRLREEPRSRVRSKLGIPGDSQVAVCVASVQERKGQDILVDQFDAVKAHLPHLELYLVGPVAESRGGTEILEAVACHPSRNSIHLLGGRTDAMEFIRAADVLLFPSRAEAQGIVVLEAMALRTPVVAADVDGIPEMIRHEETGLLFRHNHPEELVEGIVRLVKDDALRTRCIMNAEQLYWIEFSRSRQAERWADAVRTMLDVDQGGV